MRPRAVQAAGGKVLGSVRHPLNTSDFSSYLLQAQASGAKVVAFANGGGDMVNAIKQANEFGLTKNQTMVVAADLHLRRSQHGASGGAGTEIRHGVLLGSRRRNPRLVEALLRKAWPDADHGRRPASIRRSATISRAIAAAGTDEAKAVMAKMREMPVNDFYVKNGHLREDGRLVHDMYFAQVKKPSESDQALGLLQDARRHPGRSGVPPAGGRRLPAGGALTLLVSPRKRGRAGMSDR